MNVAPVCTRCRRWAYIDYARFIWYCPICRLALTMEFIAARIGARPVSGRD